MKAAVIYQKGTLPEYTDQPEPIPANHDEILVRVRAVAIKHVDRSRAAGTHYSGDVPKGEGRIIGGDGVFELPNGKRVFAIGAGGTIAEKALIDKDRLVPIPEDLDDATAAALPNAVIGSAMGLRFKADMQKGETVLINGATGFTGRVAVQLARQYGAANIIVTGRDQQSLQALKSLGATACIAITGDEGAFTRQLKDIKAATPIDIVIDYLWGRTAELILDCLKGDGSFGNRMRYVSIGSMAGDSMQLSAAILRSVDLQLSGSGLGAWTRPQVKTLLKDMLPEMFRLAAKGRLKIDTITVPMKDIAGLWEKEVSGGRRLVVMI